jgi:hypothetical protein
MGSNITTSLTEIYLRFHTFPVFTVSRPAPVLIIACSAGRPRCRLCTRPASTG